MIRNTTLGHVAYIICGKAKTAIAERYVLHKVNYNRERMETVMFAHAARAYASVWHAYGSVPGPSIYYILKGRQFARNRV